MNWFRRKKVIESDWVLVKEIEATFEWTDLNNIRENFFYYLYEDQFGHRRYECMSSGSRAVDTNRQHTTFLSIVYPWLQGKNFDNIPLRDEVKFGDKKRLVLALYNKLLDRKEDEKV